MRHAAIVIIFFLLIGLVGCEDSPEHRLGMATISMRQGKPSQALDYADSVLEEQPDNLDALTIKGKAHLRLRQYAKAVKTLNQLVERNPEDVDVRRELARWAYSKMAFTLSKSDFVTDEQLQKDFTETKTIGHEHADWLGDREDSKTEAEFIRARLILLDSRHFELRLEHEKKLLRNMAITTASDDTDVTTPTIEELGRNIRSMKFRAEQHLQNVLLGKPDHFDSAMIYLDLLIERDGWSGIWVLAEKLREQKDTPPQLARKVVDAVFKIPNQFQPEDKRMTTAQGVLDSVTVKESPAWAMSQTRLYMETGNYVEGNKVAERLFKKQPDDNETRYYYGWSLFNLQKYDLAKAALGTLAIEMRGSANVQTLFGRLLIKLGDKRGAVDYLRRAVELDPNSFTARAALIEALADNNQAANAALDDVNQLYKKNPSSPIAIRFMMQALMAQEQKKEVASLIDTVLRLSPLENDHIRSVVAGYTYLNEFEKAIQYAKELIRREPDNWAGPLSLAAVYMRSGQKNEAKRILQELHEKNPDSEPVSFQLTNLYMAEGQFDDAIELMEAALEKSPQNINARINLAQSYAFLKLTNEAIEQVSLIHEQNPKEPRAHELAARIYRLIGEFEKADIHLQQIDDGVVDANKYPGVAARLMLEKGFVDEAMAICNQAITKGKANALVRQIIVEIQLNDKKDFAQGEIHLLAYAREHPDNVEPYNMLARFYIKHNKDRGLVKLRELRISNEALARLAETQILVRYGRLTDAINTLGDYYPQLIRRNQRLALTYAKILESLILKRDSNAVANAVPVWEALISSGLFRHEAELELIELTGRDMTSETFISKLNDLAGRIPQNKLSLFHRVATYLTNARQQEAVLKHLDRWLLLKPKNASLLGMKADTLRFMNRIDEAVAVYNQAIEVSANSEPLHVRIIQTYQGVNDFAAMEREFDRWASKGNKEFIAAMWAKGNFFIELGMNAEAMKAFEELKKTGKTNDPRIAIAMGQSLAALGQFKDAHSHFASIPSHANQYVYAQVMLARIEGLDISTMLNAKERLERLIKDGRSIADATLELMKLANRSNDMQQMLEWADSLISTENLPVVTRARWLQIRANVKAKQKDWIAVDDAINQFLKLTPDNKSWQIAKIILLMQMEKSADAQKFFDDHPGLQTDVIGQLLAAGLGRPVKVTKAPPSNVFLIAMAQGRFDMASAAVESMNFSGNGFYKQDLLDAIASARKTPADQAVYRRLAFAAAANQIGFSEVANANCQKVALDKPDCVLAYVLRLGTFKFNDDASRSTVKNATTSIPDSSLAHYLLSQSASQKNPADFDEAMKHAEKLVERESDHYPTALHLVGIYLNAGQNQKALDLLQSWYDKLGPQQGMVANDLAYLLATKFPDQIDRAHEAATLAKTLLGESPGVADTMGWIEHLRGNHAQAVKLLSVAWIQNSHSAEWHQHMSAAYAAAGNEKWSKYHEIAAKSLDSNSKN